MKKTFPFDDLLLTKEELEELARVNRALTRQEVSKLIITLRGALAYITQLEKETE